MKAERSIMTRALSVLGMMLFAGLMLAGCRDYRASEAGAPDQPIAFYHSVHAGEQQIPCMYCHYSAEISPAAGLPSVKQCVGCHVVGSAVSDPAQAQLTFPQAERDTFYHAEATKLVEYWRRQEAIPWVKVHNLPEHVRFSHSPHIRVGVQCQTCHGPVEEMEKVYQFSSLQMGWCVDCHRGEIPVSAEEEATIAARSTYVQRIAALAAAGSDVRGQQSSFPNQRAGTDCFVCHY
jgi:hypothetical protein